MEVSKLTESLNLELQPQELERLKISEEQEFTLALAERRVSQDALGLRNSLRYVMVLVGLREQNWPTGEEKGLLLNFIIENYGGHTPGEIKLAFTMAVKGKLLLDSKDVTCYENFSVLYFSTIMNAYRSWAKETIQHVKKPELPAATIDVSDEEFIQSCRKIYEADKNYKLIPTLAYKVLESKLNLTLDEKKQIRDTIVSTCAIGANIQDLCKQYAVAKYFDGL